MDCGIPFCHSGFLLGGMATGCPLHNLIPEWNDLVYRGFWREALERLLKTNNFPEFTGRVCPAPCEGSCVLGLQSPAVTIKNIECSIIDRGYQEDWIRPRPPALRTGFKVAVIGSGPAGLAAADELNKKGHFVTVFERADRPGGLLMYGIPNMKLDKSLILRRAGILREEGVQFVLNTEVGRDYPVDRLKKEFNAIILCGGATKPRDISSDGRSLAGIFPAVEFLRSATQALIANRISSGEPSATGKDVVVIGGGDTGTDCVGTSLRQGCRHVVQLEIMPEPPRDRAANNPWPEWPKTLKTDYGQEEAAAVQGNDPRLYCMTVKKFLGDEKGSVRAVEAVKVQWQKDATGRFIPKELEGSTKTIPAQLVLLAMGFLGPEETLIRALNVQQDSRTNVKAEYGEYTTSVPGVFAAGDMRRGQSLVVWAIHEGRGAAGACDSYLTTKSDIHG